jgi:thioredoxin 2
VPVASSGAPRCPKCHADLPWLVDAGDADFDAAVGTKQLVLVDLWAAWCGPCRMVAPVLERLAHDYAGRVKVVKVDVDAAPFVARQYDVRSIPMLLFMRDGRLLETVVGAQPDHVLRRRVDELLATA